MTVEFTLDRLKHYYHDRDYPWSKATRLVVYAADQPAALERAREISGPVNEFNHSWAFRVVSVRELPPAGRTVEL